MRPFSIVADESLNKRIVDALRSAGFTVFYINEGYKGLPDIDVARFATPFKDIIITQDKDFGDMFVAREIQGIDVMLLRYSPIEEEQIIAQLLTAVQDYTITDNEQLTVITPIKIRNRFL